MLRLVGLAVVAAGGWWTWSRVQEAKQLGIDPWRALQMWNLSVPELKAIDDAQAEDQVNPNQEPALDLNQPTPGTGEPTYDPGQYDPDAPMEPGDWYYEG